MSIPQNFRVVEQQQLTVSNSGASGSQSVQFTTAAAKAAPDLWVKNAITGSKACQIALGAGTSAPTAVVDASALGTTQMKAMAGESFLMKKDAATYVAAICEGSDTTTLYLFAGYGQ